MAEFVVLINSDVDSEQIEKHITKVLTKEIKHEFVRVYGVFDLILKIHDVNEIGEFADKIKSMPKIHTSMILTIVE